MGFVRNDMLYDLDDMGFVEIERVGHSGMDADDDTVQITVSDGDDEVTLRLDVDVFSSLVRSMSDFDEECKRTLSGNRPSRAEETP